MNGQTAELANIGLLSTPDVVRLLPCLTYRQVDYWRRVGAIAPSDTGRDRGSGFYFGWSQRDVERLRMIDALHDALVPHLANQISTDFIRQIWDHFAESDADLVVSRGPVRVRLRRLRLPPVAA